MLVMLFGRSLAQSLKLSIEYIQSEIQSSKDNNDGRISEEAMNVPEIASGLEKFRKDYPKGKNSIYHHAVW